MEAPRVLVADDNADILTLLSVRLSHRGYDVITAADGEAALERIRRDLPVVAVLDWVMPGLTGPEVCSAVKDAEETGGTRIILLSARASDADVKAGLGRADGYLTKPFDIDELDAAIRALLPR